MTDIAGALTEMTKAAEAMGVAKGQQNFNNGSVIDLHPVIFFSTHFAEWGWQGPHLLVHLFPRAGAADVWYEARYSDKGRTYVPARREFKPRGLTFPADMEMIIKAAAEKVTFGDVELDHIEELDAWAVRFRDAQPEENWVNEGGLLEQFLCSIDAGIERK